MGKSFGRNCRVPDRLLLTPDRSAIANDGRDLAFVALTVADQDGRMVPRAMHSVHFEVVGPGETVAADNGAPTDMTAFPSKDRNAFKGLAMVIVRAARGGTGEIQVTATSHGLRQARTRVLALAPPIH